MEMAKDKDAAKGAVPPVNAKKEKPTRDQDDAGETNTADAPKPKFLPTGLSRSIVIAAVVGSLALLGANLFGNRFNLVPAPNSTNGFMYRIDHLTGAVQFCGPQGCSDVAKK